MDDFYNEIIPEPEISFEAVYNRHYITIDAQNCVTDGWSDGPYPDRDTSGTICINAEGGYQFRLAPDGEEKPSLYTMDGIPLYRWDGEQVQLRTEAELEAERAAIPEPPPSAQEQLWADVDFIAAITGVSL